MSNTLWQTKLAARIHDPAEKALVLLRDPAGHEGGTTRVLRHTLFPDGIPAQMREWVKKADHWAAAADRPQFPQDAEHRYAQWAQVRFTKDPQFIHPLSGEVARIPQGFGEIDAQHIKAVSTDCFQQLLVKDVQGAIDWRKTALQFWRFGPDIQLEGIGELWRVLPADTRIPDHSIWAHLDLTSAFAGAFAGDPRHTPALLSVSFGPVQPFIAAGRSTSDLWAGSHLLSCIAWQGMRVICEALGPDAILFPQLRGVPLVDVWLQKHMGIDPGKFVDCEWRTSKTDANPLFAAALPNKFVAIVPAAQAETLARNIRDRVRSWVLTEAKAMLEMALQQANIAKSDDLYCFAQLDEQLADFPEVHWATVPWMDETSLAAAMRDFYPASKQAPGFLGSAAWQLLKADIQPAAGWKFFQANPGALYPAVYDLLDRVAAAAKSTRTFAQLPQRGFRSSLAGEHEWLATEKDQLQLPPGKRKDTLWTKLHDRKPYLLRKGEHLSALELLKRFWPLCFIKKIGRLVDCGGVSRYVVSTHTMALATSLERFLDAQQLTASQRESVDKLCAQLETMDPVALPKSLMTKVHRADESRRKIAKRLPSLLDRLGESATRGDEESARQRCAVAQCVEQVLGSKPEAYYALIKMDGDRMGAWLAGSEEQYKIRYEQAFHTNIRTSIDNHFSDRRLTEYLHSLRGPSPARHMAIAEALSNFSLQLAPHVVEDLYKGKLLYAGGDDVMAMVSVDDLLPVMLLLRLVYSGIFPGQGDRERPWRDVLQQPAKRLEIDKGHVYFKQRLLRMMGCKATASCAAVIAHHAAPLPVVLRALHEAEHRAKESGGRNAFAIDLIKRSGGTSQLTCPWFDPQAPEAVMDCPMALLIRLRDELASEDLSRRASYIIQDWLRQLPDRGSMADADSYESMLAGTLSHQLQRQGQEHHEQLGASIAHLGIAVNPGNAARFIGDFLTLAEFLAREGRTARSTIQPRKPEASHV